MAYIAIVKEDDFTQEIWIKDKNKVRAEIKKYIEAGLLGELKNLSIRVFNIALQRNVGHKYLGSTKFLWAE